MLSRRGLLSVLALGAWSRVLRAESSSPFDPVTGYRIARYRAPTPPDVPSGMRVGIDAVDTLMAAGGLVLVDVMPITGRGYDATTGQWLAAQSHQHIPGSVWLPDVGKGCISADLDHYFRHELAKLTNGDTGRPLLIYCQSDCWMGWNAVQRAATYGYRRIFWYADGIDGWRDYERTLTPARPVPVPVRQVAPGDEHRGTPAPDTCPR
ncbi:MAG: rhodanese-like domain-containing protein [Hyphomicrobiaceae bacterium]|nr:rhodanese-like domain-containing protein [Hyphomicrobiaceae bacterium]